MKMMKDSHGAVRILSPILCAIKWWERPEQFYQSARSFGHFLKQLGEYPAESLYETIPNFHDTVKRFEAFAQAVERDVKNRARLCRSEIEFALAREKDCGALMSRMEAGVCRCV